MRITCKMFLCLVALLLLAAGAPASAYIAFSPTNGHGYESVVVPAKLNWPEAKKAAEERVLDGVRGHLVTVTTKEEHEFVLAHSHPMGLWIGAYQDFGAPEYAEPRGGWRWVTGEPWEYEAWNQGEPNGGRESNVAHWWGNDCWNDTAHTDKMSGYVVEYDTPPKPEHLTASPPAEALTYLTTVAGKYRALTTFAETIRVESGIEGEGDFWEVARAELTFQKPTLFRLVGSGPDGKVTAVSNGRELFMIDRADPTVYVLKPVPALVEALEEAFRVAGLPKPFTGALLEGGKQSFSLGPTKDLKMGEVVLAAKPVQVVRWSQPMKVRKDETVNADVSLNIVMESMQVSSVITRFRFPREPEFYLLRETHEAIELNPKVAPEEFTYQIPAGAARMRSLRSRD